MSVPWIDAPLSVAIEFYIETCQQITSHSKWSQIEANLVHANHPSRKFKNESCFARWNALCLICLDDAHRIAFEQTLSVAQFHSLRILFEWLEDGICQPPDKVAAMVAFFAVQSQRRLPEDIMRRQLRWLFPSSYQKDMLAMWFCEFRSWTRQPGQSVYPTDMIGRRSLASEKAYV